MTGMRVFYLSMLMIVCAAFMLTGCEGPTGPTGPAGAAGTANCALCHDLSTDLVAKIIQWETSVHATGGNFERSTSECAPCHTSEGFTERLVTGAHETAADIVNPTPPNCRTCHQIHTNYDETDYALATEAPVTLWINGETIDLGEGNLCAQCHQPRVPDPLPVVGGGDVEITSSHWGPHHGPQAAMLAGTGGYEISGSVAYENSPHTTHVTDACIVCHMADPFGNQAGGHTLNMTYEYHGYDTPLTTGCKQCHGELDDFDYKGAQTEIDGLLAQLKPLLIDIGIMDDSEDAVEGTFTADQAGALLNYFFVLEDKSHGVHNTKYARALLTNSIEALQSAVASRDMGGEMLVAERTTL